MGHDPGSGLARPERQTLAPRATGDPGPNRPRGGRHVHFLAQPPAMPAGQHGGQPVGPALLRVRGGASWSRWTRWAGSSARRANLAKRSAATSISPRPRGWPTPGPSMVGRSPVASFDDPHNVRHPNRMFSMAQPFAYLSATLNLEKEPLAIAAGKPLDLPGGPPYGTARPRRHRSPALTINGWFSRLPAPANRSNSAAICIGPTCRGAMHPRFAELSSGVPAWLPRFSDLPPCSGTACKVWCKEREFTYCSCTRCLHDSPSRGR